MAERTTVYVGFGANLGDRLATIHAALRQVGALGKNRTDSPMYESEPVGYARQPPFLNGVTRIETSLEPASLWRRLLEIEQGLGRVRTFPNAPRTIDLDILFYGQQVIDTAELTVPHPRMHERGFVLLPLADLAPDFVHPILGKSIADLLRALGPQHGVWRFHGRSYEGAQRE